MMCDFTIEKQVGYPPQHHVDVVLLFSGGRDSSCAAIALMKGGKSALLLSVIDVPLQSDDKTERRVTELGVQLRTPISWASARAPDFYGQVLAIKHATGPSCLNCFLVRVSVAIVVAKQYGAAVIAAGFTSYQATWIEQSAPAIDAIRQFLLEYGLDFLLPVQHLRDKQEAMNILLAHSMTPDPLEPYCHCAEVGTNENASSDLITADIALFLPTCRSFIAKALRNRGL